MDDDTNPEELIGAYAVMFDSTRQQIDAWVSQCYIKTATDIWLDQRAIDVGTRRQNGESDDALRGRLASYPDTQTVPALEAALDAMLTQNGITTGAEVFTLRMNRAFFNRGAYFDRGYRMGTEANPGQFVVILPYGTTSDILGQALEIIRKYQAAGFLAIVETRANP